jgi:protoporphyrinogen oxidase
LNYTEKLWGAPASELSAEISGNRTSGFSIWQLFNKKGKHLEGKFYYPNLGIGQLFEEMSNPFIKHIHLKTRVEKIVPTPSGYTVESTNGTYQGTHIINTLPLHKMEHLLPNLPTLKATSFQDLNLLFISLNKAQVTPYASLYFPDPCFPFTRVVEPKNRSVSMSPADQTSLCVELPKTFNLEDVIEQLISLGFFKQEDVVQTKTYSLPDAYPRLTIKSQSEIKSTINKLEALPNFILLGRNANFKYLHIHQLMDNAKGIIDHWKN